MGDCGGDDKFINVNFGGGRNSVCSTPPSRRSPRSPSRRSPCSDAGSPYGSPIASSSPRRGWNTRRSLNYGSPQRYGQGPMWSSAPGRMGGYDCSGFGGGYTPPMMPQVAPEDFKVVNWGMGSGSCDSYGGGGRSALSPLVMDDTDHSFRERAARNRAMWRAEIEADERANQVHEVDFRNLPGERAIQVHEVDFCNLPENEPNAYNDYAIEIDFGDLRRGRMDESCDLDDLIYRDSMDQYELENVSMAQNNFALEDFGGFWPGMHPDDDDPNEMAILCEETWGNDTFDDSIYEDALDESLRNSMYSEDTSYDDDYQDCM